MLSKDWLSRAEVAVVRRRHDVAVLADARDAVPHDHQAIGFAVRQRPQQHRVDETLKTAELTPMPRASVATATKVKPGWRSSARMP